MENDERSSSNYLKGKSLYKGIFSRVTLDDELFQLESDVIRKVAKQGDCIIVGWCGKDRCGDGCGADRSLLSEEDGRKRECLEAKEKEFY